jgi:hypothetical protein
MRSAQSERAKRASARRQRVTGGVSARSASPSAGSRSGRPGWASIGRNPRRRHGLGVRRGFVSWHPPVSTRWPGSQAGRVGGGGGGWVGGGASSPPGGGACSLPAARAACAVGRLLWRRDDGGPRARVRALPLVLFFLRGRVSLPAVGFLHAGAPSRSRCRPRAGAVSAVYGGRRGGPVSGHGPRRRVPRCAGGGFAPDVRRGHPSPRGDSLGRPSVPPRGIARPAAGLPSGGVGSLWSVYGAAPPALP